MPTSRRGKPTTSKQQKKPAKKVSAKKTSAKTPAKRPARRADLGAPVDAFFARQPPHLRPIVDALRAMIDEAAPDATSSLKWGMPFYSVGGNMMCAIGGHKAHVNLILSGPPGTFADPTGRLSGEGKTGRHLALTSVAELPGKAVRGWLRTAAALARKQRPPARRSR